MPPTKTVLWVDHATGIGGAEQIVLRIAPWLTQSGWTLHLACPTGAFADAAKNEGIPVHNLNLPHLRHSPRFFQDLWAVSRQINTIANQINTCILHSNTVRASLYTAIASKHSHLPFVWHMHDFWLSENKPEHLWLDALGKRALIFTASRVIANSIATTVHLPASPKVCIVHNGIDITKYDACLDKRPFRHKFQIPETAPVVGMVGRLRPWKGQTHFLQMAAQIAKENPEVYFLIIGGTVFGVDESYPQQLKALAKELNLSDKVIFTGQIEEVSQALAALDIFVHPGQPEPFGLVNIEAMAMQKPVVAFAHGALPEIVIDKETGFLVVPYDTNALAKQVAYLIHNIDTRQKLGENGRLRVQQNFNITQTVKQIETVYETIR
jgi:glycosyltransferase involved in cell wall biosynthesis